MLKSLLTKTANNPFCQKHNTGCQTIIYPTPNELFVIHDTLDFGNTATASQIQQINDIWLNNEEPEIFRPCDDWSAEEIELNSLPTINAENRLQMINRVIDVAENFYELNDYGDTFSSGLI